MNTKIADLMSEKVIYALPHHSVDRARRLLQRNHLHALPVVDSEGHAVGIVSAVDLMTPSDGTPINKVMTQRVYTIPQYNDVHLAARMMRKHKIHHLVVTHEQAVIGILSSFDLLRLVEDHRFVMKPGPTPAKRTGKC